MFLFSWLFHFGQVKWKRDYYDFGFPNIAVIQMNLFRPVYRELTVLYDKRHVTYEQASVCASHDIPDKYIWVIPRAKYLEMIKELKTNDK